MGVLPDKKKWLISFSLVYNSGLYINVSQPTVFSKLIYYTVLSYVYETCLLATFDVQNGSLDVANSTIGEVCYICHFVTGSQSLGCYVEYKCLKTDFIGNVTINRTSVDTSTVSKCVTGIYTSNYNVTFYDINYNNVPYTTEYAVKLINQSVTGLSPIPTLTTTSNIAVIITMSLITNVISSSPSPTTVCTDCDNSELLLMFS